ncbi:hypothetical protein M436DRAFT_64246 [Aureobasidium namibiae CBS 147.97]|uniref:Clr5 domain-containing protein n=1 Tax=Aureobasidium namibiae CBS 147.97 TaxID=1043004 RepID=A0A074XER3_9PEZI|nr:uncharacterized protein M436DRAFT_64246 [Aureobasidium namibiae CBS 147.97]KEQ73091.1 hypothetical protein M436DRAFT_64246 [Aureobasidium namibiae CBS 147.97]
MTEAGRSTRGKYAKLEDVQFAAAMIRDLGLDRLSPSSRPRFLIHDREYPYHEIARRVQRAKKSGTWIQKSFGAKPPPAHIQIIPARTNATNVDVSSTNNCQHAHDDISTVSVIDREGQTEYVFDYCAHLLAYQNNMRILTTPSDPDAMQKTARLCYHISRYLKGAQDKKLFVSNDAGELISRSSARSLINLNNFYKYCIVAIDLWDRQYWRQGTALLVRALELVEIVLKEQDPKMLDVLCDLCILLPTRGYGQLYEILQHKLCSLVERRARRELEQQHPWAQIFAVIKKLPSTEVVATLQQSWKCGYDHITELLPEDPWDAMNISCHSNYQLRIGENVQQHWDMLLTRSTQLQHSDASDMQRQFACGKIFHLQGNHRGALNIMEKIFLQCDQAKQEGENKWKPMEIEALEVSARCHYAIHKTTPRSVKMATVEMATAEDVLEEAIKKSKELHGIQSATTIALQHTLWLWFTEQGRSDEADLLRKTMDYAVGEKETPET